MPRNDSTMSGVKESWVLHSSSVRHSAHFPATQTCLHSLSDVQSPPSFSGLVVETERSAHRPLSSQMRPVAQSVSFVHPGAGSPVHATGMKREANNNKQ